MDEVIRDKLIESEAGQPVLRALDILIARDAYLLAFDANERSIVHRFAMYLQQQLPDLHVDCEYNRDGVEPKHIEYFHLDPDSEDTEAKTVFPDVIAHTRGTKQNYLVIELKKSTNTVSRTVDYAKLHGYKADLGYRFALFIELATGDGKADISRVEWI